jgi:diguanylate cyclase (GGDEF)-like protein
VRSTVLPSVDRAVVAGLDNTLHEVRATREPGQSRSKQVALLLVWVVRWCGFTAPALAVVMMVINPSSVWPLISLGIYMIATTLALLLAWWYSNAAAPSPQLTHAGLVVTYAGFGLSMGVLIRPALDAPNPELAATICLLFTSVSICVGLLSSSAVPMSFHAFTTFSVWLFIIHLMAEGTRFATWLALGCFVVWGSLEIVGIRLHRLLHDTIEHRLAEADLSRQLAAALDQLDRIAATDELTGVGNRRRFVKQLERCLDAAGQVATCVVLFDIDHFKAVNDTYGHGVGDDVLRSVAGTVLGAVRSHDLIGRLGGEEFAVLCSAADEETAAIMADRIRRRIEAATFDDTPRLCVTASFGVAQLQAGATAADTLRDADEALYRAKRNGRNRVELAGRPCPPGAVQVRGPLPGGERLLDHVG